MLTFILIIVFTGIATLAVPLYSYIKSKSETHTEVRFDASILKECCTKRDYGLFIDRLVAEERGSVRLATGRVIGNYKEYAERVRMDFIALP